MKIKTKEIFPKVFVLTFKTQYELCMSFVRMQEYYENTSPKFRNKYFTLEDFMEHWAKNYGNGVFNYPKIWSGFNLQGKVIEKWEKEFDNAWNGRCLGEKEDILLDKIYDEIDGKEYDLRDVYIIGVYENSGTIEESADEIINHELAHAFYSLYPKYKRECNKLLKSIPEETLTAATDALVKTGGYAKNVFKDEMQAYFSTFVVAEGVETNLDSLKQREEFKSNFDEFKKSLK